MSDMSQAAAEDRDAPPERANIQGVEAEPRDHRVGDHRPDPHRLVHLLARPRAGPGRRE
ncbi:hypothetical protein [Enhygromyxa salina]|uniref:hypothetical protein n=1 Tax=Enhygromyxa salina TaxID=215803 RepID=UPI0015E7E1A1|nr:hypothetical protein [Enhygromyxa salina]